METLVCGCTSDCLLVFVASIGTYKNLFLRHMHGSSRKFCLFADSQSKCQIPKHMSYSYLQIIHYFSKLSPALTLTTATTFELIKALTKRD